MAAPKKLNAPYAIWDRLYVKSWDTKSSENAGCEETYAIWAVELVNLRRDLHECIRVGAEYALPFAKWISFGELLTYRTGLWPYAESRTSLTLSPCGWFDLSGNASFTTMGSSMGFLLNLHPGGVNFFVAVDRLKADFNPQFIPLHDFGLNFSLGLNFAFGKKRAKLDD